MLLIEGNPVRPIFEVGRFLALRKSLNNFSVLVTIPSIVPATAHIQIEGMLDIEITQSLYKVLIGDDFC